MKKQMYSAPCSSPTVSKSSRNAVETAIDLARGDVRFTWEGQVKKVLTRILRWEDEDHSKCVEEKTCVDK